MQASLQRFTNSINVDSLHSVYPKRKTTPASFLLQDIYNIHGGLHFRFFVGFLLEELMKKREFNFQ